MSSAPAAAEAVEFQQNAKGDFVCPDCGNTYSRRRAVRRHMSAKHGWPPSAVTTMHKERAERAAGRGTTQGKKEPAARKEAPPLELEEVDEDTVSFQIRAELRELALPLQEKLATIEKRLVVLNREAQDLREARNQIERTLKGLIGTQQPAGNAHVGGDAVYRKKFLAVQDYLKRLPPSLQGGFTANSLSDAMKADGITPPLSGQTAARAIQELHDQGVVRLDRISKGGGKSFLLNSRNGNREE